MVSQREQRILFFYSSLPDVRFGWEMLISVYNIAITREDRWWTKILSLSLYLHKTYHTGIFSWFYATSHSIWNNITLIVSMKDRILRWKKQNQLSKICLVLKAVGWCLISAIISYEGESVNILYLYSRLVSDKISWAQHIHEVPLSLAGGAKLILIRVWRILLLGHVLFSSLLFSAAIDERQIAPPSITYQWQIENIFWAEIYGKNLG